MRVFRGEPTNARKEGWNGLAGRGVKASYVATGLTKSIMKLIALPSGKIINLELVAFVDTPGLYGDEQEKDARLTVHFSAISYAVSSRGAGGGSLQCALSGDDIKAFLSVLGVDTAKTLAETTRKRN
jgi:hypothetical protein